MEAGLFFPAMCLRRLKIDFAADTQPTNDDQSATVAFCFR